jgi:hypothetical protein
MLNARILEKRMEGKYVEFTVSRFYSNHVLTKDYPGALSYFFRM